MIKKLLIGDYLIIVFSIVLTIFLFIVYPQFNLEKASYANVVQDGKLVMVIDLSIDKEYRLESDYGYNIVNVENGKIAVIESYYNKNQICVKMGYKDRDGETIVCLPHNFFIEVISEKESDVDGVAY